MAEKTQNFFDYGNMPPTPDFVRVRQTPREQPKTEERQRSEQMGKSETLKANKSERPQKGGIDLLKMFNFKGLSLDSDRTLILAVIFLLLGDSADELLLLALLYVMI